MRLKPYAQSGHNCQAVNTQFEFGSSLSDANLLEGSVTKGFLPPMDVLSHWGKLPFRRTNSVMSSVHSKTMLFDLCTFRGCERSSAVIFRSDAVKVLCQGRLSLTLNVHVWVGRANSFQQFRLQLNIFSKSKRRFRRKRKNYSIPQWDPRLGRCLYQ